MAQSASSARPPSHSSCHVLRRVLVRHSTVNLTTGAMTPTGQGWTMRACDVPLFSDLEQATGVCTSCASGWTHPENHPLVPVYAGSDDKIMAGIVRDLLALPDLALNGRAA